MLFLGPFMQLKLIHTDSEPEKQTPPLLNKANGKEIRPVIGAAAQFSSLCFLSGTMCLGVHKDEDG